MISSNFDIWQFSELANNQDYLDVISLANQEATEAERLLYQKNRNDISDESKVQNYVRNLKDLIWFMRYGFLPNISDKKIGMLFYDICREISNNGRSVPRCSDRLV
jgi:hypothetical protein